MTDVARAAEHPVVRATLEEAGWTPSYRFDPSAWEQALRDEGYSVHTRAVQVLADLGGLTVVPPRSIHATFWSGAIEFDPVFAATGESPRIRQRERSLERLLCPVGEWSGEYILLVADDGSVWAETTFQVRHLGDDLAGALRLMILADRLPEMEPRTAVDD